MKINSSSQKSTWNTCINISGFETKFICSFLFFKYRYYIINYSLISDFFHTAVVYRFQTLILCLKCSVFSWCTGVSTPVHCHILCDKLSYLSAYLRLVSTWNQMSAYSRLIHSSTSTILRHLIHTWQEIVLHYTICINSKQTTEGQSGERTAG